MSDLARGGHFLQFADAIETRHDRNDGLFETVKNGDLQPDYRITRIEMGLSAIVVVIELHNKDGPKSTFEGPVALTGESVHVVL
jgi:hypothetical protein